MHFSVQKEYVGDLYSKIYSHTFCLMSLSILSILKMRFLVEIISPSVEWGAAVDT